MHEAIYICVEWSAHLCDFKPGRYRYYHCNRYDYHRYNNKRCWNNLDKCLRKKNKIECIFY